VALLGHQLSEDGRFLAYSLKRNHADLDELHRIDLASASKSPLVLSKTYVGGMVFDGDQLFFAEALEVVQPGFSSFGAQAIQSVLPLRLSEGVRALYRTSGQPQGSLSLATVWNGYLYFQRSATTRRVDLMRLDVRSEGAAPEMVLDGKGDDTLVLRDEDMAFPGRLLVETSSGSALKRLISTDPEQPLGGDWRHVLPAQPEEVVQAIKL
jgi:hypothetical protein